MRARRPNARWSTTTQSGRSPVHQRTAARDRPGQAVLVDAVRLPATHHAVAGVGDDADLAVGLVRPPREPGVGCEVLGLVDEARAQAAAVDLLQADDVEPRDEIGDRAPLPAQPGGRRGSPKLTEAFETGPSLSSTVTERDAFSYTVTSTSRPLASSTSCGKFRM